MNMHTMTFAATMLTTALLVPPSTDGTNNANRVVTNSTAAELHEALIGALDRGDTAAAAEFFVDAPILFVVNGNGEPSTLTGENSVDSLVSVWASDVEDPEPTEVVSFAVLTDGPASCLAVFELKRPMSEVRHLRGTSVMTKSAGENGPVLEIRHLHLSPAGRQDLQR